LFTAIGEVWKEMGLVRGMWPVSEHCTPSEGRDQQRQRGWGSSERIILKGPGHRRHNAARATKKRGTVVKYQTARG
jgi:hypothetical protein